MKCFLAFAAVLILLHSTPSTTFAGRGRIWNPWKGRMYSASLQEDDAPRKTTPLPAISNRAIEVRLSDLKSRFSADTRFTADNLPAGLSRLIGKRVRISGYVTPNPENWHENMTEFMLREELVIPDSGTILYRDYLSVAMLPNAGLKYTFRPVVLEGLLRLLDIKDGSGMTITVFSLSEANVVPATRDKKSAK